MERRPTSTETAATLRRHPELRITKGRVERLRRVRASCQKIACLRLVQLSFLMSPCHCLVTSGRIVKSGHMWIWIVYPAPAGIAGTAGIAKCLDLLGPSSLRSTKGSAGGYLINTEYTKRARPQNAGKHTYLEMPSTVKMG